MIEIPSKLPETAPSGNIDAAEVARFQALAKAWWDPTGKFRPLHQIGPVRLAFIREELERHFGLEARGLRPFEGLSVLDVGCGGGLVSEPLARLGGRVTAIDPGEQNIAIARAHAEPQGLAIDYRTATVEDLAAEGAEFDAVISLEVVEHVPDVAAFVTACAGLVRPGGLLILSTINRTMKAYALAIVGAEYVLGWLPRGTHQWERFVTPDELGSHMAQADLAAPRFKGFVYSPLSDTWRLSSDTSVNYLVSAARPNPHLSS
ncbi:bifunctional 2-polyprenyl-6-hydroxyphenol methylase/3-demethylubiquinol 3-O-methyltransferase UbiG [Hyphomicrobium sp.]|uniref:bifunctional 2-polyprenyl-6-hydroxyphenol methylase/3-demethylubiquinol 3-O-methyltransferase UbiG n=1 Tax=Hyphomicrobium sp. TaxID=82 RepID=UPI002FDE562F